MRRYALLFLLPFPRFAFTRMTLQERRGEIAPAKLRIRCALGGFSALQLSFQFRSFTFQFERRGSGFQVKEMSTGFLIWNEEQYSFTQSARRNLRVFGFARRRLRDPLHKS